MPNDRTGNGILDSLPPDELAALRRDLDVVELEQRFMVYERGKPIAYVYFPTTAVLSVLSEMEDGRGVEVATIGREGMSGLPIFLQAGYTSAHMSFAQIPGGALRIASDRFEAALANGGELHRLLQRYTQAMFTLISQNSACNRLHGVEQRCARWLLMTHDRVDADEFPLTQEFLGQMLGVQRTSVTEVAQALQDAGVIAYSRGRITITDRPGLEAAACECYTVIAEEFARLTRL